MLKTNHKASHRSANDAPHKMAKPDTQHTCDAGRKRNQNGAFDQTTRPNQVAREFTFSCANRARVLLRLEQIISAVYAQGIKHHP